MKTMKIILLIILVPLILFCLAFMTPYIGHLFNIGSKPTFIKNDLKSIEWLLPEGKKIKYISKENEIITLEVLEIETCTEISYVSGFELHKKVWVDIGNGKFPMIDLTKGYNKSGKSENEEIRNSISEIFYSLGFTLDYQTYGGGSDFNETITINNKVYDSIGYSESIEWVDVLEMGNNGNKISEINPNYKILTVRDGKQEDPYYISRMAWWSKTLGLMQFQRISDGVIFTRML